MVRKWGTGVQPTSTWGILRLQPTDPNLLPALPRGTSLCQPVSGGAESRCVALASRSWKAPVFRGEYLCFFQKKVLKKIPSDISAKFGVNGRIFHINLNYSIVIVGGWRLEFSNAQLPYCGINASKVFWNQMASLRMMIHTKGAWWFGIPPKKKNIPTFLFSGKKANDDGRRNPGASCGSFWCDRNLLLRRCFFFAERNVEFCW